MNLNITIVLVLLFNLKSFSQDIYRTETGTMVVTAVSLDTIVKLTTKEMLLRLDYDNATFEIKIDKSTFKTGNDSLDRKLSLLKYDIISYTGKFELEYIDTKDHPPLDFESEGILSTTQNMVYGQGKMEHLATNGYYSCLLSLKFNIKIEDLGLNLKGFNLSEDVQIDIIQMVLNPEY